MLTLVTVSYNNPDELEKTVTSVSLQSKKPDDFVVVDSSDRDLQPHMEHIAKQAGARYLWVVPEGVYPAMRHSLTLVDEGSWVWWINSSDWLAGKKSVEIVKDAINDLDSSSDFHWIVGELLRHQDPAPSIHPIGSSGEDFLKMLNTGRTGFPHPSTIFRKAALNSVKPYRDNFSIASDYATALRFGEKYGPPVLLFPSLAVHDPRGLTSRHPVRNLWERSQARRQNGSLRASFAELWRLPRSALKGLIHRLVGEKPVKRHGNRADHFPLVENIPFDWSPGKS